VRSCTYGWVSLGVGLALATAAHGENVFDYSLKSVAGYSDNLNRTATNEEGSGLFALGGTLDYQQKSARLDTNIKAYDLGFAVYSADSSYDQVVGNLVGDVIYSFVPERFQWFASDNFGQGQLNEFQPSGPGNVGSINLFSTGPVVYINLSDRFQVSVTGTYSNAWYQDTNGDSDQYSGGLSLIRVITPNSNVRVGANYQRIDYTDPQFSPNVDTTSYFLGYQSEVGRTHIKADVGWQHVDYGNQTSDDPLLRLELGRQITAYSSLNLQAGDVYNDGAGLMASQQSMPGGTSSPGNSSNGQVFEDRYLGLGWSLNRARTHLYLSGRYDDQNYIVATEQDLSYLFVNAGASRDLSRTWTVGADYYYWKTNYKKPDVYTAPPFNQDTDETTVGVFAGYHLTSTMELRGQWQYWFNSVVNPGGDASENRFWLTLIWQPPGSHRTRMPTEPVAEPDELLQ
jgi:hypothetical protein